jgi:DtxR family Mn-dependent transcriptional regulator
MYLVRTAMLSEEGEPVPLSLLAQWLEVSPASANEMCRKLEEQGLVSYQPYKGVRLTPEGARLAQRVLGRRRLWQAFLEEHLGIDTEEADEVACRMEHITSDHLVERLADYLHRPTPTAAAPVTMQTAQQALTECSAGQRVQVAAIEADNVVTHFLQAQGIAPGIEAEVLAVALDGTLLLALPAGSVSLAHPVAAQVMVVTHS